MLSLPAAARSGLPPVSLDWSRVPDELVERCGLVGLENLLVQAVLEAELAVVHDVDENGIAVSIGAAGDALRIEARAGALVATRRMVVSQDCESTIQLDLAHELTELLLELKQQLPEPVQLAQSERPGWWAGVGVALVLPGQAYPLPNVNGRFRYRVTERFVIGGGAELSIGHYGGVLIVEPAISASGQWTMEIGRGWSWSIGLEASLLGHVYDAEGGDAGAHADGRFGLLLELSKGPWVIGVTPFVRLLAVEHGFGSDVAFASDHWGVLIRGLVVFG